MPRWKGAVKWLASCLPKSIPPPRLPAVSALRDKSLQVVAFLRHLQRHIPGKILAIWDGAPIHRSVLVQNYVATTKGRLVVERLPAYAPERNPVESMWGHLKTQEIANLVATQAWELSFEATAALRRMRRRRLVIAACYTQAELWP